MLIREKVTEEISDVQTTLILSSQEVWYVVHYLLSLENLLGIPQRWNLQFEVQVCGPRDPV